MLIISNRLLYLLQLVLKEDSVWSYVALVVMNRSCFFVIQSWLKLQLWRNFIYYFLVGIVVGSVEGVVEAQIEIAAYLLLIDYFRLFGLQVFIDSFDAIRSQLQNIFSCLCWQVPRLLNWQTRLDKLQGSTDFHLLHWSTILLCCHIIRGYLSLLLFAQTSFEVKILKTSWTLALFFILQLEKSRFWRFKLIGSWNW